MITVSDAAAEKTKEILTTEGKAEWGLRFFTAGSSCCGPSYNIDIVESPVDGDEVIDKNGTTIWQTKVTGHGDATVEEFKLDFSLAARRATKNAFAKLQEEIVMSGKF